MDKARDAGLHSGIPVEPKEGCLDIRDILKILPHRYPFSMVDKIVEFDVAKRAVGIKNVTINEPFFTGHFPDRPIMPGVLVLEAMAQVGGILLFSVKDSARRTAYFVGMNKVKFRMAVIPGDVLRMELTVTNLRSRIAMVHGVARVGQDIVAEADIMFGFTNRK
jgi:3-hydroxyacyl-[acyl-carrier-protein] dehydratase